MPRNTSVKISSAFRTIGFSLAAVVLSLSGQSTAWLPTNTKARRRLCIARISSTQPIAGVTLRILKPFRMVQNTVSCDTSLRTQFGCRAIRSCQA